MFIRLSVKNCRVGTKKGGIKRNKIFLEEGHT